MELEWEPARDEHGNVVGLEIGFFDDDPDGEEDRAGEGWYYRIAGDRSWSGAWHSEEDAEAEAIEELEDRRNSAAYVLALHRRTGWPIAGMWRNPSNAEKKAHIKPIPTKLYCMTPDGCAIDITGTYYFESLGKLSEGCRAKTYTTEAEWIAAVGGIPGESLLAPADGYVAEMGERIAGNAQLMSRLESLAAVSDLAASTNGDAPRP